MSCAGGDVPCAGRTILYICECALHSVCNGVVLCVSCGGVFTMCTLGYVPWVQYIMYNVRWLMCNSQCWLWRAFVQCVGGDVPDLRMC